MFKRAQVAMLSTNEKANIVMNNTQQGLFLVGGNGILAKHRMGDCTNQHLYILSDEPILEPCYAYSISTNTVEWLTQIQVNVLRRENWKKIIATTDISLCTQVFRKDGTPTSNYDFVLPQPSQSFIEHFVEQYNKGNIITEVMVEYESYHGINTSIAEINYVSGDGSLNWKGIDDLRDFKLKVNSKDNTITIKKVKDSYSREEVIELIKSSVAESHDWSRQNNDIHSIGIIEKRFLNKWIEQNL